MINKEPVIRTDDFNLVIRDRYFIKMNLSVKSNPKNIEFFIIYTNIKGITEKAEGPSIFIVPPQTILLPTWVECVNNIRKLEDKSSEEVLEGIKEGKWSEDEVDYPNEYTMSESNWYKHSYTFLQPFYTHEGALLRLSYLIGELILSNSLDEKYIVTDKDVEEFPVK